MAEEKNGLIVTPAPHFKSKETTTQIMFWVIGALAPVTLAALYFFQLYAFRAIAGAVLGAVLAEYVIQKARKLPVTISDGSAILTGLLLALTLPPKVPWWTPLIGGIVAISLGKHVFGGLGYNIFNPALVGRAVLTLSWPAHMSRDWFTYLKIDSVTGATPLYLAKQMREGLIKIDFAQYYKPLLLINKSGSIGEISNLLIIAGGLILLWKGIIDWRIPGTYVISAALFSFVFKADPVFNVLAGGLLLGAVFMATDYVTSPVTDRGRLIFGIGCGFFTILMRVFSSLPEAVMYAILFMNAFAPLIDRYTQPKVFGAKV